MPIEPSEREILEKIAEQTAENNKILRGLRRDSRWAKFGHWLKFLIILGAIGASYYYISPYLDKMMQMYANLQPYLGKLDQLSQSVQSIQPQIESLGKLSKDAQSLPKLPPGSLQILEELQKMNPLQGPR
ncbi:MAG: hypothetical protein HY978_00715 [Candidatus Liptonbacteria bacterium]|nr:hypothetical protein [Candidatus Liptonbacteria bacterium]